MVAKSSVCILTLTVVVAFFVSVFVTVVVTVEGLRERQLHAAETLCFFDGKHEGLTAAPRFSLGSATTVLAGGAQLVIVDAAALTVVVGIAAVLVTVRV